jgi:hypothetical protein
MSHDAIWSAICEKREADKIVPLTARERERALRTSVEASEGCEQTSGQNMVEHGLSVRNTYIRLLGGDVEGFRLPAWWAEWLEKSSMALSEHAYAIERYQVLHDCGKYLVRTVSDDGRVSYPGHAGASAGEFERLYAGSAMLPETFNLIRALIVSDMVFHTGTVEDIAALSETVRTILLVTSLCELHSNAAMFGGIESDSFKIKWKRWEKLARRSVTCP